VLVGVQVGVQVGVRRHPRPEVARGGEGQRERGAVRAALHQQRRARPPAPPPRAPAVRRPGAASLPGGSRRLAARRGAVGDQEVFPQPGSARESPRTPRALSSAPASGMLAQCHPVPIEPFTCSSTGAPAGSV
jgi:hypothetical protein